MITLVLVIAMLIYSVILHEVSHGAAAYLLGDPTARDQKRLTLNPFRHIDPVGTVVLPVLLVLVKSPALLGWAKPVPFNPAYFKNPKTGIALVAAAGPLTNFALAASFGAALRWVNPGPGPVQTVLVYGVLMNVVLGIFNLVPIPPMDGSKVVGVFLPPALRRAYFGIERFGFLIIFALLYFGLLSRFLAPLNEALVRFFLPS